jgi:hypothetical protein
MLLKTLVIVAAGLAVGQVVYREAHWRPLYADYLSNPTIAENYATFSLPPLINNDQLAMQEESATRARMALSGQSSGWCAPWIDQID